MTPTARQYRRKPGRDGEWIANGGGSSAKKSDRQWVSGWSREASCPIDPMKRRQGSRTTGPAPIGGAAQGRRWIKTWEDSRRTVRTMRRAGYVTRHRWPRRITGERQIGRNVLTIRRYDHDHGAHLDYHPDPEIRRQAQRAPVAGLVAVDPWETAEAIRRCADSWKRDLKFGADLAVQAAPVRCGRRHACPVCAAAHSQKLAAALRDVIADADSRSEIGSMALVTLTQRADLSESLHQALERIRDGWRRMTRGRPGRRFKAIVDGWYFGLEVTRTWAGKSRRPDPAPAPPESAQGWHVHAHIVIRMPPGIDQTAAQAEIGQLWERASAAASAHRSRPGYGWDPVSGGCTGQGDRPWAGAWWRSIAVQDPQEVYQACKYPTPLATLGPVGMAEWLSAAFGRRWHQGGGAWRSVIKDAKALDLGRRPGCTVDPDSGEITVAPDFGETISGARPNDAPSRQPHADTRASWRLKWEHLHDVPQPVIDAVSRAGGLVHTSRLTTDPHDDRQAVMVSLPSSWSERSMQQTDRAFAAYHAKKTDHKDRREELRTPPG